MAEVNATGSGRRLKLVCAVRCVRIGDGVNASTDAINRDVVAVEIFILIVNVLLLQV